MSIDSDRIHDVLLREWNPLGCRGIEEAGDCYIVCVPLIRAILNDFRSEDQLVDFLYALEVNYMNVAGDRNRCRLAARRLAELRLQR